MSKRRKNLVNEVPQSQIQSTFISLSGLLSKAWPNAMPTLEIRRRSDLCWQFVIVIDAGEGRFYIPVTVPFVHVGKKTMSLRTSTLHQANHFASHSCDFVAFDFRGMERWNSVGTNRTSRLIFLLACAIRHLPSHLRWLVTLAFENLLNSARHKSA